MKFNDIQTQKIYDFVMNYNSNEEFKKEVETLYDNDISKLTILSIYALEEILRYGNKEIYKMFIKENDNLNTKIIDFYDDFVNLMNSNEEFKNYKFNQLNNNPESLSKLELFILNLVVDKKLIKEEKVQEESVEEETVYVGEILLDNYNPILYATDGQIRETLGNLLIGELIFKILERPEMKGVKSRQMKPGIVDLDDKNLIINKIKTLFSDLKKKEEFSQVIENRFTKVKLSLLVGKKEMAFSDYLKYNTNISVKDIFGDTFTEEDKYEFIRDMFRKR